MVQQRLARRVLMVQQCLARRVLIAQQRLAIQVLMAQASKGRCGIAKHLVGRTV